MASIPPPPDRPTAPVAPIGEPAPPGPSSRATIIAIVASVAAIAIIGATLAIANSGASDATATPSVGSTTGVLAAPVGVAADPSAFKVVLTWTPGEGIAPAHFVVSRNGSVASTLDPTTTRWVDDDVLPETRYTYRIAAVGADGTRASSRVTTHTTSAPLDTTALRGIFNVHFHATSHFGFSDFGSGNGNLGWRFVPTCAKGPCDTKLADLHQKDFRLTLERTGVSYKGDVTLHAQVRCGSATVSSTVTVTVRVTDAGVAGGRWVATRIEGTMKQFEPAQLGCVASGATFDVAGHIVH